VAAAWRGCGGERARRRVPLARLDVLHSSHQERRIGPCARAASLRRARAVASEAAVPQPRAQRLGSTWPGAGAAGVSTPAPAPPVSVPGVRGAPGNRLGVHGARRSPRTMARTVRPWPFENSRGGESDRAGAPVLCPASNLRLAPPPSPRTGGEERPGDQVATAGVLECSRDITDCGLQAGPGPPSPTLCRSGGCLGAPRWGRKAMGRHETHPRRKNCSAARSADESPVRKFGSSRRFVSTRRRPDVLAGHVVTAAEGSGDCLSRRVADEWASGVSGAIHHVCCERSRQPTPSGVDQLPPRRPSERVAARLQCSPPPTADCGDHCVCAAAPAADRDHRARRSESAAQLQEQQCDPSRSHMGVVLGKEGAWRRGCSIPSSPRSIRMRWKHGSWRHSPPSVRWPSLSRRGPLIRLLEKQCPAFSRGPCVRLGLPAVSTSPRPGSQPSVEGRPP
jgi:hypothetical protein